MAACGASINGATSMNNINGAGQPANGGVTEERPAGPKRHSYGHLPEVFSTIPEQAESADAGMGFHSGKNIRSSAR
jgi:hypothetical protein